MAEIEKEKKRSKKKTSKGQGTDQGTEQADASNTGTPVGSSGSSWRDFITSASAALDDLASDVNTAESPSESAAELSSEVAEAPAADHSDLAASQAIANEIIEDASLAASEEEKPKRKPNRGRKKSSADEIEWNAETQNLEIIEDQAQTGEGEKLSRFEELARQVAESVAQRDGFLADEPTPMGDDSANNIEAASNEIVAEIEAASTSSEAAEDETSFDINEGEQDESALAAQVEGEIVNEQSADEIDEASLPEPQAELQAELQVEAPSEQLAFGAEDAEVVTETAALNDESVYGELAQYGPSESEPAEEEQNAEFISEDTLMSVIESLLFSTDKPVSIATIKQIFKGSNIRTKDITRAIDMLASEFAAPNRGVSLEEVNGGYQLRTKSDNADYLRRLAKVRPFRLSGPALEVMAMVAYKQPITKHEIDEIRGVESGHLLRALMERGLVCFGGKSDLPGKPMTYGSTRKFLETFGLRNLKELPTLSEIDELLPEGIGEVEEKETLSDITDSMSTEISGTYSDAEDELSKINESLQQVDTTSEFFEQEKVRERDRRDRERAQDLREKLVVGEAVEEKDRRWLDRYDAKLFAATAAAAPAAEGTVEASEETASPDGEAPYVAAPEQTEESIEISEQLETLTEQTAVEASPGDEDELEGEDASWMDESVDEDDLTGNGDWDEDIEGGKNH